MRLFFKFNHSFTWVMDVREPDGNTAVAKISRFVVPRPIFRAFSVQERQIYFVLGLRLSKIVADCILSVLITFLTDVWHLKLTAAVLVTTIQDAAVSLLKIVIAFLLDAYLGNFWMLLLSTVAYCAGLGFLRYSYPKFSKEELDGCLNHKVCLEKSLTLQFYVALVLVSLGKAGQELSLEIFGPFRIEEEERLQETGIGNREKKFICYLWCSITIVGSVLGIALAYFAMKWSVEFTASAILMAAALMVLLVGTLFYAPVKPTGSPISRIPPVLTAAIYKLRLKSNDPENDLMACAGTGTNGQSDNQIHHHTRRELVFGITHEKIRLTTDLRVLDKAAVVKPSQSNVLRLGWKLCTVQQVEDTKILFRMLPLPMTFLMYGVVRTVGNTYFLEQGNNMNARLGAIQHFPLQSLVLVSLIAQFLVKKIYDAILGQRIQTAATKKSISYAIKIGLGMLISIFCCVVAACVETKRLRVITEYNLLHTSKYTIPMTFFWLTPQFILLGAMDGLVRAGIESFFHHEGPASLERYAVPFAEFLIGTGAMLSVICLVVMRKVTDNGGWIKDNIDSSHLDYFYHALSIGSSINLGIFALVMTKHSYKRSEPNASIGKSSRYSPTIPTTMPVI